MERLVRGSVVVLPFPFSDLSSTKKRPAVVITPFEGDDILLCQITSNRNDKYSIHLDDRGFQKGKLPMTSHIRPNRLFTADKKIILRYVGILREEKIKNIQEKIITLVTE